MNLRVLSTILAAGSVLLIVTPPTQAGTGKITQNGAVHELSFCVSIRFTASPDQITDITNVFAAANAVLADATDGQFVMGHVDIVNNSGASQQAEIWIRPEVGDGNATLGLYGHPGAHITLYFPDDFSGSPSADGNAYTVVHELAHHVWGLLDEYSGLTGDADCEPPPGSMTASYCLMDDYFVRGGNIGASPYGTGTYTLNEFCVASNHDPDADTSQQWWNGKSCWEQIDDHGPGTAPGGLPEDAAPELIALEVRFPATDRRFVVCIDRSGSMSVSLGEGFGTALDNAKEAASLFVDLTQGPGAIVEFDRLGITSFSSSATSNLNLVAMDAAGKNSAKSAINALVPSGGTAIGLGLQQSLGLLTSQTDHSCAQTIILLTDGFGNSGPSELSVIPALVQNDVSVVSVAIGTSVSVANLQQVASQTSGKFFQVSTAVELPALFAALSAEVQGGGVGVNKPGVVTQGQSLFLPVLVDSMTTEATFVLTWPNQNDDLDLALVPPSGGMITPSTSDPDVEFISGPNTEILAVGGSALEPGTWSMRVFGAAVSGSGVFTALSLSDTQEISFTVATDQPEYAFPETMQVLATPHFMGIPVQGVSIEGSVTRPDGSEVAISLADDGGLSSGDQVAGDGSYSTLFASYSGDGAYQFKLTALNTNGLTAPGEELFASIGAPATQLTAPPFTREGSAAAVITGVPPFITAHVEIGPETLNLMSQGKVVTAYLELPATFDVQDIEVATVAITAINGMGTGPILALPKPTSVGDFDGDGIPDRMVKFSRQELIAVLSPGMHSIRIEGFVGSQLFRAEREIGVIMPGQ